MNCFSFSIPKLRYIITENLFCKINLFFLCRTSSGTQLCLKFSYKRDCGRNFKWPSTQREHCPIHKSTLKSLLRSSGYWLRKRFWSDIKVSRVSLWIVVIKPSRRKLPWFYWIPKSKFWGKSVLRFTSLFRLTNNQRHTTDIYYSGRR